MRICRALACTAVIVALRCCQRAVWRIPGGSLDSPQPPSLPAAAATALRAENLKHARPSRGNERIARSGGLRIFKSYFRSRTSSSIRWRRTVRRAACRPTRSSRRKRATPKRAVANKLRCGRPGPRIYGRPGTTGSEASSTPARALILRSTQYPSALSNCTAVERAHRELGVFRVDQQRKLISEW